MRVILSAPGSRGDVNPMVAIGKELLERGHDVVISLAEPYAEIASAAGLTVEPVISRQQFEDAIGTATVWRPIRGPITVFRLIIADYLPLHQDVIHKYHQPGNTVLVSHPLDLASRIFRDANPETPLASVLLQPVTLRTPENPARLSPWCFEVSKPAWFLRMSYWFADALVLDPILRKRVNAQRRDYQLPPVRRIMNEWWLSPDRLLGMFPDWFAPATRSFCPRLVHCGFPLNDGSSQPLSVPDDRPIVFTAGTAHQHCRAFFETATKACQELDLPGILLTTHTENIPTELPPSVRPLSYVSLGQLLPHCRAIVHHGGIGTTSQALAAGIPQVIRPLAFDQFDNANRVELMDAGAWLRKDADLARVLKQVLDLDVPNSLELCKQRLQDSDAPSTAATEIETLLTHK
ncbi:MAG: nucleotide disphospho-sugar-binding domain-containing protein [Planctomycetota bacterium]